MMIQLVLMALLPVTLAVTLHEAAHGYVARYYGDPTAWHAGRITLNPFKHIDWMGTVLVPLLILLLSAGNILFGWAKPVPVDFANLRHPKRDMLWVALAGPMANAVMAVMWAAVLKLSLFWPESYFSLAILSMAKIGIWVNISLMVINLLPLPPLDGGRIIVSLLPCRFAVFFASLERFGFVILLVLLLTGVLGFVLRPMMFAVGQFLAAIFQLPL